MSHRSPEPDETQSLTPRRRRREATSGEREDFVKAVGLIMEAHPEGSRGFVLAERPAESQAPATRGGPGTCLLWGIDPRTGERICLQWGES